MAQQYTGGSAGRVHTTRLFIQRLSRYECLYLYHPPPQYPLLSSQYPLLSSQYPLLSSQYPLLSSQYPLLSSQYPLLSSQYPLLSSQYPPLFSLPILVITSCVVDSQVKTTITRYAVPILAQHLLYPQSHPPKLKYLAPNHQPHGLSQRAKIQSQARSTHHPFCLLQNLYLPRLL